MSGYALPQRHVFLPLPPLPSPPRRGKGARCRVGAVDLSSLNSSQLFQDLAVGFCRHRHRGEARISGVPTLFRLRRVRSILSSISSADDESRVLGLG